MWKTQVLVPVHEARMLEWNSEYQGVGYCGSADAMVATCSWNADNHLCKLDLARGRHGCD